MATRFYFQANTAPGVSLPLDAGWTSTANVVRRFMGTAKDATTETVPGSVADLSSSLAVQLVSPPLAAQSITGTITIMSRARELNALDNINKRYRSVRVYSADGTVLRGTFNAFAATTSTTEFTTTFAGQIHAQNNGVGTLAVEAGDVIVVEVGFGLSATGDGTSLWETVLGGTGTDHAVSNGDTTGTVAWVEFSQTLTFAPATVTLTPATAARSAHPVTAAPGMVTRSLTTATATASAQALTPTPNAVVVALVAATFASSALAVTASPGVTVAPLTAATATASGRPVTGTPGPVSAPLTAASVSAAAATVTPQPGVVSVALTPATAGLAARANTVTPGVVTVNLAPGAITSTGLIVSPSPGPVTTGLVPAEVPVIAMDFGVTPGEVSQALTPATLTLDAESITPAGIGVSAITLTRATGSYAAQPVDPNPGLVLAPVALVNLTWVAQPVTATPGPLSTALTPAATTASGVTLTATPGAVTADLTAAVLTASGASLTPTPGALTTATGTGTAAWSALPVVPEPVEGILLMPAVTTLRARKVTPQGSVLPLNTYELPLARVLLDCLREVLETRTDSPPQHYSLRVGEQVPFDLSENEDLCCEGLAYVKINSVYASTNFPNPDEDQFTNCGPLAWAANLEMGILRCAPVGSVEYMPTDAEWTDSAELVANDSAAMRMAIACFRDRVEADTPWVARPWLPIGPVGACTGGTQIVTVGFIPC